MTVAAKPKPKPDVRRPRSHVVEAVALEVRAASDAETAAGLCGIAQAVALPYDVVDAYNTTFKPGCLDKTRANKVAAKKVKLYLDHNYGVKTHVGVVLALPDVGGAAVMTAGLFDTVEGRTAKEYLSAVLASGAETGVSIGFYERAAAYEPDPDGDADSVYAYSEIELDEISITPRPAVPGATVTGVRREDDGADPQAAERVLRALASALPVERVRQIVDAALAERGEGLTPDQVRVLEEAKAKAAAIRAGEGGILLGPDGRALADPENLAIDARLEILRAKCAPFPSTTAA